MNGTLQQVKQSVLDYFIFAVLDKTKRKELIEYAFWNFEPKEQFVWCPRRIQRKLLKRIPCKKYHSQTLAGARRRYQTDYRRRLKVPHSSTQNNARISRVRNAGQNKIEPRNSHPSAQKYWHHSLK